MPTKQLVMSQKRHHVLPDGTPQCHLWLSHDKDYSQFDQASRPDYQFSERKENPKNALKDTIEVQSEKSRCEEL